MPRLHRACKRYQGSTLQDRCTAKAALHLEKYQQCQGTSALALGKVLLQLCTITTQIIGDKFVKRLPKSSDALMHLGLRPAAFMDLRLWCTFDFDGLQDTPQCLVTHAADHALCILLTNLQSSRSLATVMITAVEGSTACNLTA